MNNVYYEGLRESCLECKCKKNKGGYYFYKVNEIINQNNILSLTISPIKTTKHILSVRFLFIRKEKEGLICDGGVFDLEKSTGYISNISLNSKTLSFHEIMSKFFKFEIVSLYQRLIQISETLL